jgi:hypothetical protein
MTWTYLKLKGKEKLAWAEDELRYEQHRGVHTYHNCDCGRMGCRRNMCVKCWEEEIKGLKEDVKQNGN